MIKLIVSSASVLAAAYGTVSDIEILFILIALIGLIYSVLNIRDALLDFRALKQSQMETSIPNYQQRVLAARYGLKTEVIRAVIQIIFLALGIFAGFFPEPPAVLDLPTSQIIFGILFRWGLTLSSALLSYKSFLTKKIRRELRKLDADQYDKGTP